MRLYNIFYICKLCLHTIQEAAIGGMRKDEKKLVITDWRICKETLDVLRAVDCFEERVLRLYRLLGNRVEDNEVIVSPDEHLLFESYISEISYALEILVKICDDMEIEEAGSGIDVKIPKCNSLKEYMDYLKDIDFIFSQCPYLLCDEEEIRFNNVDVGSQWLVFVGVGSYISKNIAKLIKKSMEIKSYILTCKQQEEMLEEMRQKNEVGREVINAFRELKRVTMDKCVAELEEDIGELKDNEERDKVKRSVESLVFLIDKGVEIYASIETPKEIKALFPIQKDAAALSDNIQKLIEEKTEDQ